MDKKNINDVKDAAETAKNAAEDVKENIKDAAENAGEKLADVKENIKDAAENAGEKLADVKDDIKEKAEDVIDKKVNESTDDIIDEVNKEVAEGIKTDDISDSQADLADEISNDLQEEIKEHNPRDLKGKAPNSEPIDIKKGRKPFNKASIIAIIVAAAVVVAAILFVGFNQGWFNFLKKGSIQMADTSHIEVYKEDVEVTDDDIDSYVDSLLATEQETVEIKEGKLEEGDTAIIDYKGKLKDTGKEFEGGTAEGYGLVLGSGTFIEGFEEGLIGKKIGDTVDIDLTFPEDYSSDEVAGKDVTFEVKINSAERTQVPDLTDEWVKEYSEKYCPETYNTVDEFRNYCKDTLVDYRNNYAIYDYLDKNSEVKSYDAEKEEELMEYSNSQLESMASMYGMSADDLVGMYGSSSAEDYNRETADNYLKMSMIVDKVCQQNNITYTDEEIDEAILQYLKDQKLSDEHTVEDFVEEQGGRDSTWMWLFTNLEFKFKKAMQSLTDNVVVLEEKPTEEDDAVLEEELEDELVEDVDESAAGDEADAVETEAE